MELDANEKIPIGTDVRGTHCMFTIKSISGFGAFSIVYQVSTSGTDYALKVEREYESEQCQSCVRGEFTREIDFYHFIQKHFSVQSLNVFPRLYDSFDLGSKKCIVLDYVPKTLFDLLDEKTLSFPEIHRIFRDISVAVAALHSYSFMHTDIKPENILLGQSYARLSDFGSIYDENVFIPFGQTSWYRSPEAELQFGLNTKSDIWSLGAILLQMACQLPAFAFNYRDAEYDDPECRGVLKVIERRCGKFPLWMIEQVHENGDDFFNVKNELVLPSSPIITPFQGTIQDIMAQSHLPSGEERDHFLDLILHMLTIDPIERYDITQVMEHPFVQKYQ